MSKFYDRADSIKSRIESLPALNGVGVLVYRQKDLQTEIDLSLARVGSVIIIRWEGGENADPEDDSNLQILSNYNIQVASKTTIAKSQVFMDDLNEEVMRILHGWNPTPALGCGYEANISGTTLVPDDDYLIFQIDVRIPINFEPYQAS